MTVPTKGAPEHLIVLDFETYYSTTFSLSKLTTEEYIRSPEFEVIGVSVKLDDGPTEWCTGDDMDIYAFLQRYPWDTSMAVAHNAMFDMAILNWKYRIRPLAIADTLSMARALHGSELSLSLKSLAEHYCLGAKGDEVIRAMGIRREDFTKDEMSRYGGYCCNDTELTRKLFDLMSAGFRTPFADDLTQLNKPGFPALEMRLIDRTIRMFTEPALWLDESVLHPHLAEVQSRKAELMSEVNVSRDELMSNPKLAALLASMGVDPPTKLSPTTGKETHAFAKKDVEFIELLEHPNLAVQAIVAARLGVKSTLEETRTTRFISMAGRSPMPVPLRYYAAHTGRWGGSDKINLQNIPRESPLKKAIRAPEGYILIDCDSSQIEARTLAWLAGQDDLVAAFDAGRDVYKIMASSIYGKDEDSISKDERFVGKTTILGAGYGVGWKKFQLMVRNFGKDITDNDAEYTIKTYRDTYPLIPALWREAGKALDAMLEDQTYSLGPPGVLVVEGKKGIRLPNGLYLRYPNLRWVEDEESGDREMMYDVKRGRSVTSVRMYGAKLVENICQALARIVVGEQLLMVSRRYKVALTVHDSLGVIAPEARKDEAMDYVMSCMRIRPKWAPTLPLNCEAKMGVSYGG
jgi:DNA polymerase I-like protein with 3'-5' exonuclease and polymerase domains